ncbi:MAG: hypothetical protein ABSB79_06025 [Syntrophales bacterium]
MITDPKIWTNKQLGLYATLLNLTNNRILNYDKIFKGAPRIKYFQSINHTGDLFIDPDTGIATGKKITPKRIFIDEIDLLLKKNSDRVIAIYQHNARGKMSDRLNEVIKHILKKIRDLYCTYYMSSNVAMIFISKNGVRIKKIHDFHRVFYEAVPNRIKSYPPMKME